SALLQIRAYPLGSLQAGGVNRARGEQRRGDPERGCEDKSVPNLAQRHRFHDGLPSRSIRNKTRYKFQLLSDVCSENKTTGRSIQRANLGQELQPASMLQAARAVPRSPKCMAAGCGYRTPARRRGYRGPI